MSDQTENQGTGSDLDSLKAQAADLGVKHHPAMGAEKLQKLIDKHLADEEPKPVHVQPTEIMTVSEITELQELRKMKLELDAKSKKAPVLTESQKRAAVIKKAGKLIRIRVTCMNPNKRDWEGEMYTVSNDLVKFAKYVPFNNDEGWHVPQMILNHMKERQCQVFFTSIDDRGNKTRKGKLVPELAIEIMNPLTVTELQELAQRQSMAKGEAA